jgi:hypothetical protein
MTSVRLPISRLALVAGLLISAVSAWYSITGLGILFSGAFWAIVTMGVALEIGKLVAASWIYRNWSVAPVLLRGYLSTAVIVLMLVNAIGIFGFLSKAHLSTQTQMIATSSILTRLTTEISQHQVNVDGAQKNLTRLDALAAQFTSHATDTVSLSSARSLHRSQQKERAEAEAIVRREQEIIRSLDQQREPLLKEVNLAEAEVGPIRYVAELFYGVANPDTIGRAVRWLILALVGVFDPLAVLLIVAANTPAPERDAKGRFLPKVPTGVVWTDGKEWKTKKKSKLDA